MVSQQPKRPRAPCASFSGIIDTAGLTVPGLGLSFLALPGLVPRAASTLCHADSPGRPGHIPVSS